MPRIVTIHQPNYLPWIGLFSKVKLADCLIIYDTAQYVKNSIVNRNKIRTNDGWYYLTIPLGKVSSISKIIDIMLPQDRSWQKTHWKLIHDNYLKTDYFSTYMSFFEELYGEKHQFLREINEKIIHYLLKCFSIQVEVIKASEIVPDSQLTKTDLMLQLLKGAGADRYLSGPSGKDYLEFEKFEENHIELSYAGFQHPVYAQRYPGFELNMSAIDMLFNLGPQASRIIEESGSMEEAPAAPRQLIEN